MNEIESHRDQNVFDKRTEDISSEGDSSIKKNKQVVTHSDESEISFSLKNANSERGVDDVLYKFLSNCDPKKSNFRKKVKDEKEIKVDPQKKMIE